VLQELLDRDAAVSEWQVWRRQRAHALRVEVIVVAGIDQGDCQEFGATACREHGLDVQSPTHGGLWILSQLLFPFFLPRMCMIALHDRGVTIAQMAQFRARRYGVRPSLDSRKIWRAGIICFS